MIGRRRADPVLPAFQLHGSDRALSVRRMAQARRLRLSVDPRDGAVRLMMPVRAALAPALKWVESQRPWIESQLAALPGPRPFAPDSVVPIDGCDVRIDWQAPHPRTARRIDDRLMIGGPVEMLNARVTRWIAGEARRLMAAETRAFAAQAGVAVGQVSVGDPKSRWGSCSAGGDIRYSWRLLLAPPAVREATVAHEVAHRLHMDHSAAFHAAVMRLLGRDPADERRWLRINGASLHGWGRV